MRMSDILHYVMFHMNQSIRRFVNDYLFLVAVPYVFKALLIFTVVPFTTYEPEDHWACIAHLSAEDMLKTTVIEEKKFGMLNLSDLDQGQWTTLTFGHTA